MIGMGDYSYDRKLFTISTVLFLGSLLAILLFPVLNNNLSTKSFAMYSSVSSSHCDLNLIGKTRQPAGCHCTSNINDPDPKINNIGAGCANGLACVGKISTKKTCQRVCRPGSACQTICKGGSIVNGYTTDYRIFPDGTSKSHRSFVGTCKKI